MITTINRWVHRRVQVALMTLVFVSGCAVAVPIPVPSETLEEYMDRELAEFIETGTSSRDDILEKLGSPTVLSVRLDDSSIWIYSVREYLPVGWRICGAIVIPDFAAIQGYGGSLHADAGCTDASGRKVRRTFLEIDFDSLDVVSHRQVVSLAFGDCTDAGFCWNQPPTFLDPQGNHVPPTHHCAVHIYTPDPELKVVLKIKGANDFPFSISQDEYQIVTLQHGQRVFIFAFDDGSRETLRVNCNLKSTHFVTVRTTRFGYKALLQPEHVGRPAIIAKRLKGLPP